MGISCYKAEGREQSSAGKFEGRLIILWWGENSNLFGNSFRVNNWCSLETCTLALDLEETPSFYADISCNKLLSQVGKRFDQKI